MRARRIRLTRGLSVVSCVLVGILVAGGTTPALANDPLTRCQSGAWGSSSGPYTLDGQWSPFIYGHPDVVRPGDVYRIDGTGSIKIGSWPWDGSYDTAGAGWGNLADNDYYPAPGTPKYSLVGKFNANGQGGYLGPGASFRYDGSAPTFIWLHINDSYTLDNSGSWSLVIHQFR
jgi:hypothetical protein